MSYSKKYSELSKEDQWHSDIRDWIDEQGFPMQSLDELVYEHDMVKPFMTEQQRKEAQELLDRFDNSHI